MLLYLLKFLLLGSVFAWIFSNNHFQTSPNVTHQDTDHHPDDDTNDNN
ncbi:hypothetical protein ACFP3T_14115 [Lactiplantibacillus dongliensis]|uniref:Extracellular protein n=1 Tax=Lactiplantibacillus dongliensis TaxID=2559919 RepID=A0ABW1RAL4_9LACO|nr:hypothetical protein [Lactiplantibacillus dongliensis]